MSGLVVAVLGAGRWAREVGGTLADNSRRAPERVAAVLWNQPPDDDLITAAGSVTTTAELTGVIEQMLGDARASVGVGAFYRWWLDLNLVANLQKDPMLFPDFTPALQADMANETATFGVDATLNMNGTFQTLMTASWSFINARLANVYGIAGVTGDALQRTLLPAGQRAGLLTQPALQALSSFATRNSPPRRGTYVLKKFFCQPVPSSPASLPGLESPPPGTSVRLAVVQYRTSAVCAACHVLLDTLGFAFEGFDAIGRVRSTDNGAPIDTTGTIQSTTPPGAVIDGPVDLAAVMSQDRGVETCMAQQWLTFALGRELGSADDPSVQQAFAQFQAAGFNLKAVIVAVLTSDAFLTPN